MNFSEKIRLFKNTRPIKDPFRYETAKLRFENFTFWRRLFPKKIESEVSIWRAYRLGYDQAYQEMLENFESFIKENE